MTRQEWLASLKVGDEVVVRQRSSFGEYRLCAVTSAPRTMVVVDNFSKFRRSDGTCTARSSFYRPTIEQPTQEIRVRIESGRLCDAIEHSVRQRSVLMAMPLSTLRQIAELLGVKP